MTASKGKTLTNCPLDCMGVRAIYFELGHVYNACMGQYDPQDSPQEQIAQLTLTT